jgi:hypothetical protein
MYASPKILIDLISRFTTKSKVKIVMIGLAICNVTSPYLQSLSNLCHMLSQIMLPFCRFISTLPPITHDLSCIGIDITGDSLCNNSCSLGDPSIWPCNNLNNIHSTDLNELLHRSVRARAIWPFVSSHHDQEVVLFSMFTYYYNLTLYCFINFIVLCECFS